MKSINRSSSFYLDYNATAPLVHSINEWLNQGAVPFANPSSVHSFGKESRRLIRACSDYLYEFFSTPHNLFDLYFHSGASESINNTFKGFALDCLQKKLKPTVYFASTDHACVVNQRKTLELLGVTVREIAVDEQGLPKDKEWINQVASTKGPCLLNLTWVHNETGVVWPVVEIAKKVKEQNNTVIIHVDAVQAPGKIDCSLNPLTSNVDIITFSGHKFGAMKGVGFTFIKNHLKWSSLIEGGGQQKGRRSGTENPIAVHSLFLALKEMGKSNPDRLQTLRRVRDHFEDQLVAMLDKHISIVCKQVERNANTSCFIFNKRQSDVLTTALDLAGIAVSSGSACSSGATVPNRVLLKMGRSEKEALSSLRFSFGPEHGLDDAKDIAIRVKTTFERYL